MSLSQVLSTVGRKPAPKKTAPAKKALPVRLGPPRPLPFQRGYLGVAADLQRKAKAHVPLVLAPKEKPVKVPVNVAGKRIQVEFANPPSEKDLADVQADQLRRDHPAQYRAFVQAGEDARIAGKSGDQGAYDAAVARKRQALETRLPVRSKYLPSPSASAPAITSVGQPAADLAADRVLPTQRQARDLVPARSAAKAQKRYAPNPPKTKPLPIERRGSLALTAPVAKLIAAKTVEGSRAMTSPAASLNESVERDRELDSVRNLLPNGKKAVYRDTPQIPAAPKGESADARKARIVSAVQRFAYENAVSQGLPPELAAKAAASQDVDVYALAIVEGDENPKEAVFGAKVNPGVRVALNRGKSLKEASQAGTKTPGADLLYSLSASERLERQARRQGMTATQAEAASNDYGTLLRFVVDHDDAKTAAANSDLQRRQDLRESISKGTAKAAKAIGNFAAPEEFKDPFSNSLRAVNEQAAGLLMSPANALGALASPGKEYASAIRALRGTVGNLTNGAIYPDAELTAEDATESLIGLGGMLVPGAFRGLSALKKGGKAAKLLRQEARAAKGAASTAGVSKAAIDAVDEHLGPLRDAEPTRAVTAESPTDMAPVRETPRPVTDAANVSRAEAPSAAAPEGVSPAAAQAVREMEEAIAPRQPEAPAQASTVPASPRPESAPQSDPSLFPEGETPRSAATSPADPRTNAAPGEGFEVRNQGADALRRDLGLDELPPTERKTYDEMLESGKGLDHEAVQRKVEAGEALNDSEVGALALRGADLKAHLDELRAAPDVNPRELAEAIADVDRLTRNLRESGRVSARALAFRNIVVKMLDADRYSVEGALARARAKAGYKAGEGGNAGETTGRVLDPKVEERIRIDAETVAEREARLAELETRQQSAQDTEASLRREIEQLSGQNGPKGLQPDSPEALAIERKALGMSENDPLLDPNYATFDEKYARALHRHVFGTDLPADRGDWSEALESARRTVMNEAEEGYARRTAQEERTRIYDMVRDIDPKAGDPELSAGIRVFRGKFRKQYRFDLRKPTAWMSLERIPREAHAELIEYATRGAGEASYIKPSEYRHYVATGEIHPRTIEEAIFKEVHPDDFARGEYSPADIAIPQKAFREWKADKRLAAQDFAKAAKREATRTTDAHLSAAVKHLNGEGGPYARMTYEPAANAGLGLRKAQAQSTRAIAREEFFRAFGAAPKVAGTNVIEEVVSRGGAASKALGKIAWSYVDEGAATVEHVVRSVNASVRERVGRDLTAREIADAMNDARPARSRSEAAARRNVVAKQMKALGSDGQIALGESRARQIRNRIERLEAQQRGENPSPRPREVPGPKVPNESLPNAEQLQKLEARADELRRVAKAKQAQAAQAERARVKAGEEIQEARGDLPTRIRERRDTRAAADRETATRQARDKARAAKSEATEATRQANEAESALKESRRRIASASDKTAEVRGQLESGYLPTTPKPNRRTVPLQGEIDAAKEELKNVRKALAQRKAAQNRPSAAAKSAKVDQERLDALQTDLDDLNHQLDTGEYVPRSEAKVKAPGFLDRDIEVAKWERDQARKRIDTAVNDQTPKTGLEWAGDAIGLARVTKLGLDIGAAGRQGWLAASAYPGAYTKAFARANRALVDPVYAGSLDRALQHGERAMIRQKSGLAILKGESASGTRLRDEVYSSDLIDKIPVVGRSYKPTERWNVTFHNELRAGIFDDFDTHAARMAQDSEALATARKEMASIVNVLTGRGEGVGIDKLAEGLGYIQTSPRFAWSRAQILPKLMRAALRPNASPLVQRQALRILAANAGMVATIYGTAKALGGEVETLDLDSPDWMKIKVGDFRTDFLSGVLSPLRQALLIVRNYSRDGEDPKMLDRLKKAFIDYKMSPQASLILGIIQKHDAVGQKYMTGDALDIAGDVAKSFGPMSFTDAGEAVGFQPRAVFEGRTGEAFSGNDGTPVAGKVLGSVFPFVGFTSQNYKTKGKPDETDKFLDRILKGAGVKDEKPGSKKGDEVDKFLDRILAGAKK